MGLHVNRSTHCWMSIGRADCFQLIPAPPPGVGVGVGVGGPSTIRRTRRMSLNRLIKGCSAPAAGIVHPFSIRFDADALTRSRRIRRRTKSVRIPSARRPVHFNCCSLQLLVIYRARPSIGRLRHVIHVIVFNLIHFHFISLRPVAIN